MGGAAVSIALRSGELWVLRHDGQARLSLEPSVYLEKGRLLPRATKQILLTAHLQESEARIGWTLAKAQDTPLAIRDLRISASDLTGDAGVIGLAHSVLDRLFRVEHLNRALALA